MMEKKKALLVLAGGRAAPDVLSLFWVQPQLVRVIISEEGWLYENAFVDIARSLPNCKVGVIHDINAYDLETCEKACIDACRPYPDTEWDWTFTIGSAPKVTGIAAYEVAKQKGIPCWHIDTQHEHLVSLVKTTEVDKERFFHLTLDDYMKIQHRTWKLRGMPGSNYREAVKKWVGVARELAISPNAMSLLTVVHDKKVGVDINLPSELANSTILQSLEQEGVLKVTRKSSDDMVCCFTTIEAAQFVGTGDWLEFYVWHEVISIGLADEHHCQWGCLVIDGPVDKELDLALIYKAQLIVAECKAEQNPFQAKRNHLGKLEAKANVLGGSYVSKLFITNQYGTGDSFKSFCDQAEQYKIVVVTAEKLPEIGKILKKEATNPTYPRI